MDCEPTTSAGIPCERCCTHCGSSHTLRDDLLRPRPSLIMVLCFGWLFLLIRGAFSMRHARCTDCGQSFRYKSAGSWVALAFLILILFGIIVEFWHETQNPLP